MTSSSGTDPLPAHPSQARVLRALVVAVTPTGVVIPSYTGEPELPLDLPSLVLLQALAGSDPQPVDAAIHAAAASTGADPGALAAFVEALAVRSLLGDDTGLRRWPLEAPPAAQAVPRAEDVLVMLTPTLLRVTRAGFEHLGHDGELRARLSPVELLAASRFRLPSSVADALEGHRHDHADAALDDVAMDSLVARLLAVRLLEPFDPENPNHDRSTRNMEQLRDAVARQFRIKAAMGREVEASAGDGGDERTLVVPVDNAWQLPPAALGLLVAYAKGYDGGRLAERYRFHPRWVAEPDEVRELAARPSVFLFSNYLWNHADNLALSAAVKATNPGNLTIHGGPDTPKYPGDAEAYFAANPHVDVAVHGEGEATLAELLDVVGSLGDGPPDLSVLRDVAGLTFRGADGPVRTADRERIQDLDTIPSPLLTGLFDSFAEGPTKTIILETNRGCPYGCTFCDWGSATLSRIRKFDLDRVFAELEWCARHRIETVSIGDANFGIFERDVEIAEKIAELKATYGYPRLVATNYAKNTVKHLRRIIEVFAESDIVAEGVVSLQTMDADTLVTIRRKNIRVDKYNDLSAEFRRNGLPLAVDLMLGLPGSTFDSFRRDVQECIDRDVRVRIHPTQLLPNSPMNDPVYRAQHGIVARPGEYIEQTESFTREEWFEMWRLAMSFLMGDLFGLLRQVAKYVRQEVGLSEVAFYEQLSRRVLADQDRWPATAVMLRVVPTLMVPPVSWHLVVDEMRDFVVDVLGVPDDEALDTVLAVQHALQPAAGRTFPLELTLLHDYAAWHRQVLEAREAGHRHDWTDHVPRLRELGPAVFVVDDPEDVCHNSVGQHMVTLSLTFASFELRSPVARPRIKMRQPVPG